MKDLKKYLNDVNEFRVIFGQAPLRITSVAECLKVADHLDNELSPENLSCDGELSSAAVSAKFEQLSLARKQLRDAMFLLVNA